MLKFVTKKMYRDAVENGAEDQLRKDVFPWHLKSVQDAMVMDKITDSNALTIGEIGGGDTRILPALARENAVYNIEKFEGDHGGPAKQLNFTGVKNLHCWVGASQDHIEDDFFDLIFSVSVVEHVTNAELPAFIEDCARILKPGGQMIHAVDCYLPDPRYVHNGQYYKRFVASRTELYLSAFDRGLFAPLEAPEINSIDDLAFMPQYISNPDSVMQVWNRVAPGLADLRDNAMSVAIMWAGTKL